MSEEKKPTAKKTEKKVEEKKVEKKPAEKPTEKPAEKTEKKAEKKSHKGAIITWSIIGGILLVGGITCAIVLPIVLNQVNYKESFEIAETLKPQIRSFYYDFDNCEDVTYYVDSTWSSPSYYDEYVTDCKESLNPEMIANVKKLSETGAVKTEEIKPLFEKFNSEFSKSIASVDENLDSKLETYKKWHKFIYEADDLSYSSSTEEDFKTVAGYATDTGVEQLKTYAETWLTKALEIKKSYKDDSYSAYRTKYNAFDDWMEENQPDITEILPLSFEDNSSAVYKNFNEVYDALELKVAGEAKDAIESGDYEHIIKELMK